ncbi:MAG TPA: hypothetical protein VFK21_12820 [Gammaproteobacteria bacterium]|nr:hypothetical protein [Gammaproteobacteria bacterium]
MKILKSIGAVAAGFVAVFVLSLLTDAVMMGLHLFPAPDHPELCTDFHYLIITLYTAVYSVAGGYLTAWLAPAKPIQHALALGVLGLLASLLGSAANWGKAAGHEWYPIALIVMAIPTCWLGAWLYLKLKR